MIRLYFHPTPNPAKIALFLEETGLAYEVVPVDTSKGEQHTSAFRAINPNGKVPAIDDTAGPCGKEVVRNSGLDRYLEKTISVHPKRVFKPAPRFYAQAEEVLGVKPEEVLFVSSNGFDIWGAKSFGFKVARIERVSPEELRRELMTHTVIGPKTMFKALRMLPECHGQQADFNVGSLAELAELPLLHPAGVAK
jgi:hypothetical protein